MVVFRDHFVPVDRYLLCHSRPQARMVFSIYKSNQKNILTVCGSETIQVYFWTTFFAHTSHLINVSCELTEVI